MTKDITQLISTILGFSKSIEQNFVTLADLLHELSLTDPEAFQSVLQSPTLKRRKGYYLAEIGKHVCNANVPKQILNTSLSAIGWTKAQIIARHFNTHNWNDLIVCATTHTARDLKLLMKGIEPIAGVKTTLLSLSPEDHAMLVKALLKYGASPSGNGHANKETALMKMVAKLALYEEL